MSDTGKIITVHNPPWFDLTIEAGAGNMSIHIAQSGHDGIDRVVVERASVPGLIVALQEACADSDAMPSDPG